MENVKQMLCEKCHKLVPISDIRYSTKGKNNIIALCTACRTKNSIPSAKLQPPKKEMKPQRQVYLCENCSYKFGFNPKSTALVKCPYCGKSNTLTKYEGFTSTLINDEAKKINIQVF